MSEYGTVAAQTARVIGNCVASAAGTAHGTPDVIQLAHLQMVAQLQEVIVEGAAQRGGETAVSTHFLRSLCAVASTFPVDAKLVGAFLREERGAAAGAHAVAGGGAAQPWTVAVASVKAGAESTAKKVKGDAVSSRALAKLNTQLSKLSPAAVPHNNNNNNTVAPPAAAAAVANEVVVETDEVEIGFAEEAEEEGPASPKRRSSAVSNIHGSPKQSSQAGSPKKQSCSSRAVVETPAGHAVEIADAGAVPAKSVGKTTKAGGKRRPKKFGDDASDSDDGNFGSSKATRPKASSRRSKPRAALADISAAN